MKRYRFILWLGIAINGACVSSLPAERLAKDLSDSLLFHASFDYGANADVARGDAWVYTAKSIDPNQLQPGLPPHVSIAPSGGRFGGCLRFSDTSDQFLVYRGAKNVPYDRQAYDSTVSMWLKVDPEHGLKPGYVDPLQITDKKWNDASIFLDFSKDETPRLFRLGVFADYESWNPDDKEFESLPHVDRPMVIVKHPPFSTTRWTHVAFTLSRINGEPSSCSLFINGEKVGTLDDAQKFTWNVEQVAIMLGIQYIGDIDDFAIFDRVLDQSEIRQIMQIGVASSVNRPVLKRAFVDGTGPGWQELKEADFVNVNCHEETWKWQDGVIHCSGIPIGVIRTNETIKNFELVCEWKHKQKGGNSGVFVWASQKSIDELAAGNGSLPHGIEVQVLDLGYAELYQQGGKRKSDWFTSHGDVFPTGPTTMTPFPPVGPNGRRSFPSKHLTKGINQWNHYYIRAINGEIRLWVNGEEVSGGTKCQPADGYLCLESEGAPIEFRNLRIRRLR